MTAGTDGYDRGAAPPARHALYSTELVLILPARPSTPQHVRQQLRSWLDTLSWPTEAAEDILLAVTEAVTNVIDHAYPPGQSGHVHLHGWASNGQATAQRVTVSVVDRGRWRTPDPARAEAGHRGHGLNMMRELTAHLHLQPSAAGTTVILVSPSLPTPVPLRAALPHPD